RQIGPYRLQSRIGAGGMGTVYLGFSKDDHPAAVKVPSPGLADDPEFRSRFRTEVAAARRVRGGSVAAVLDADLDGPRPWMATEYVEGRSLTDAVAQRGPFTGHLLDGLAVGLADALVAIHAAGVVHRDLKPSNILVTWEGPKVIDFGIARAADSTNHTRTGTLIGTLVWMAPEQLRGERAGPGADIFAWGACMAFAATGRQPFAGERPEAVAVQIMTAEPDLAGVPAHLAPVLATALDKDPARRPTAAHLVARLVGHDVADAGESVRAAETALAQWWSLTPPPTAARSAPQSVSGPSVHAHQPSYQQVPPERWQAESYQPQWDQTPATRRPAQYHGPAQAHSPAPTGPARPRRRGWLATVVVALLAIAALGGVATALTLRERDSRLTAQDSAAAPSYQQTASPGRTPATHRNPTTGPSTVRTTTPTPRVSRTGTPTPSTTPGHLTLAEASNTLNERGFTVTDSSGFARGRTLNVLIGRKADSPNVPQQFGFFFVGTEMIGKDFVEPSAGISVAAARETSVVLRYDLYEPSDKVCCPSGGNADVTFRWDGTKLNVDPSTIPPSDPAAHGSRR
ncbi:protein kinase domain-containing protein, partial [Candidatus Protofrankia californiensis]|uniref:protein kinase domain-containing protein n=1 Tax=Candidatus Protofrankia californiensis TaxID=1839754 RepID=UPI001041AB25